MYNYTDVTYTRTRTILKSQLCILCNILKYNINNVKHISKSKQY